MVGDRDLGTDYFDRLNPGGLRRLLTKRLEGLGVTLEALPQVASKRFSDE